MNDNSNSDFSGSQKHPMMGTILSSPLTASVISKLVSQPTNVASSGIRDTKMAAEASHGELINTSQDLQREIRDNDNTLQLFPDIELSKQTLITSILSPQDMFQTELNYSVTHPLIPSDIANEIIEIIKPELENYYRLSEGLYSYLEDSLFKKGAHIRMVLPESAVDHLVNDRPNLRVESMGDLNNIFKDLETAQLGFLGSPEEQSPFRFESNQNSSVTKNHLILSDLSNLISVTDNFGILKKPSFQEGLGQNAIKTRIRELHKRSEIIDTKQSATFHTESFGVKNTFKDIDLKSAIYKSPPSGSDLFLQIPDRDNLRRHSIGRPLYSEIPMESFIPVHFPGRPEKAIGGFILVDQDGYFLTMESQRKFMNGAQHQLNSVVSNSSSNTNSSNGALGSSLMEKAKINLRGADNIVPLTYLSEIFGNILEENLLKRIKNGIHGVEGAIAKNNDIYMVMIARSLSGSQTQIVYIPKEFFTYIAFQYNPNGTGRSLLSDMKNLISLRAVSLYAKVANQIRNAISITDVNVEIDPRDQAPQRTLEKIVDLTSQTRTQYFPWGLNTPSDIANWWHRAGFQLNVSGHPGLPSTKITYEHRSHDKPVSTLSDDETLNDMIHMHFGITPEMRDSGMGAQFATSVANNNILFSKRVSQFQKIYNAHISDLIRIITTNDNYISSKIRKKIKEQWGKIAGSFDDRLKVLAQKDEDKAIDFFMDEVIESLKASLPSPETTTIQNQMSAFKEFKEAVEETFNYILSDDAVSQSILGESAEKIVALREPLKAQLIRDWMLRNNFMSELFDLVETDDEGNPKSAVAVMAQDHIKRLSLNILEMMKAFTPVSVAVAKDLQTLSGETPETPVEGETTETVPEENTEDTGGFQGFN